MKRLITVALAALGLAAAHAAVDGTNVWVGAATGGSWSNVANWRAESPTGKTVAELLAGTAVYDLRGLASGATVTNDYTLGNTVGGSYSATDLVIGGLIAGGEAGDEWTVAYGAGANPFRFASSATLDVRGGALTWRGGTSVNGYPVTRPVKTGAGVFRFAEATGNASFNLWEAAMTVNEGTLAFTNQSAKTYAFKFAGESRLLVEGGTASLGSVFTDDGISTVPVAEVREGAVLDFATSYNTYYPNWSGDFAGDGVIQVSNGGSMQFKDGAKTGPFAFAGTYRAQNATATFGALGANPSASAEVASSGWLRFTSSQALARLFGDGVDGGVAVPEGATLTVTGPDEAAADVFKGRIGGAGGFVKDGADYTLTLDGASTYAGATRVKAGTLALRRGFSRKGLCAMWRFDSEADFGRATLPDGLALEVSAGDVANVSVIDDGVSGSALRFAGSSSTRTTGCTLMATATDPMNEALPHNGQPFTVSFWMRPTKGACGKYTNFLHLDQINNGSVGWGKGGFFFGSTQNGNNPFHEFAFYTGGWSGSGKGTTATSSNEVASVKFEAPEYLLDGTWHHVVGTYSNRVVTLYVDGVKRDSVTRTSDLKLPSGAALQLGNFGADGNHKYAGDLDEIQILRGAWSDAEVAAEYAAKVPVASDPLPAPFARWMFDAIETADDGNTLVFRDSGSHGLDLKCVATNSASAGPACAAMTYPEDLGGGYVRLNTLGDHLRLKDASAFASAFPKGGAVTVSARLCNANGAAFLILGDGTKAGSIIFRFAPAAPRELAIYAGAWSTSTGSQVNYQYSGVGFPIIGKVTPEQGACWSVATVTYDPAFKELRCYLDGALMYEHVGSVTLAFNPVDVIFGAAAFDATTGTASSFQTGVTMDDLAIWDAALDASQVRAHVRALRFGGDATKPVLPAASPVTVDAGATLRAEETFHRVASLAGAGTVEIAGSASFAAASWTGFTGAVCGLGELVLEGSERLPAAASVSANVRFAGITVTADDATATEPFVTTTGRVTVPAAGVLTFAGGTAVPGRAYPIARGDSYDLPADTSGWTVSPATGTGKVKFRVRDGVLYAWVPGGMALIIR